MHRANRYTQRMKTLRQHGSGRRTRRTEKQKGRGSGAKPKIYRGGETYARETSSAQAWTEKGLRDSQRQQGKSKSKTYRQGKTSSGTDGSKNNRQRRVSTESKRQSAKLQSREGRKHKNAERYLPRGSWQENKNKGGTETTAWGRRETAKGI